MTRPSTEHERADRERDYRKHDPRPGEPGYEAWLAEIIMLGIEAPLTRKEPVR